MREERSRLDALDHCPLPDWDASEGQIDRRVRQLDAILKPVTGKEAKALVACFGPDDCYGVA